MRMRTQKLKRMSTFVLFNTVRITQRFFWSNYRIRKIQTRDQRMEAPLAIRAWTLFYSLVMALAEPCNQNNDNRPRLFFISAQYNTLQSPYGIRFQKPDYRQSYSLTGRIPILHLYDCLSTQRISATCKLPLLFQPAFAGITRLIEVPQGVNPPVEMK